MVPAFPSHYPETYGRVEAYGAMCLILALDRQLTGAYWINLNDPGFPFQPFVEHTNFVSRDDYGARHIAYFGNYLPRGHKLFEPSKEEIIDEFLPGIRRLNPDFEESWIQDSWLFRAPFAQPIVTVDYHRQIPPHLTPIPGLYLANMFQVYPQDRGQNYSIALAERLVQDIL